ncbi:MULTISPECIES: hypothetical protein [unclassified Olleya]|jgi:hypothetical protein|uniref:hypothetical protein n=1 Tax=unclassified Olleya TaxID=2615019 RepID=UPI0011A5BD9A|nr:hypothetical protein [Olleya sp. Hel_I_94]TVZ50028.1 hypothetical protein JM82_0474 [Olleya sp. Hel_I_94]
MKIKQPLFGILLVFGLFFNCQNETINSVDQQSETLEYNSTLFNLISTIALDEDINCMDFEYPLTVSIYDADFQLADIVTIDNDDALYLFLQTLDTSIVASLNFPITMVLPDEQQIVVNSNQALQSIITLEGSSCDSVNSCTQTAIANYLMDCNQLPTINGLSPNLTHFNFQEDNNITVLYEGDMLFNGAWDISTIDGNVYVLITISGLDNYNGQWEVVQCESEQLVLEQEDLELILTQNCSSNPFSCFEDINLTICDADGDLIETFNLDEFYQDCDQSNVGISYHISYDDAVNNANSLTSTFTNVTNPQTIYVRVAQYSNPDIYQIFTIVITVEDCT